MHLASGVPKLLQKYFGSLNYGPLCILPVLIYAISCSLISIYLHVLICGLVVLCQTYELKCGKPLNKLVVGIGLLCGQD